MSRPFALQQALWQARESSLTSTFDDGEGFPVAFFGQLKLSVYLATFSGSITFQASADGSNWYDLPFVRTDTDAALTAGVVDAPQPAFVLETGSKSYIVPGGPWPHVRVVMVRTDGAITGVLQGYEHDSGFIGSR